MQGLSQYGEQLLEKICSLSQDSLLQAMDKYLKKYYKTVHTTKEFIYAVGDIPVALTAHMDTVFPKQPANLFYDRKKNVMWAVGGAGFDDKAGVFSILQIIKSGYRPTILLTTDEEIGAIGASALVEAFPEPASELKYIIELDRRGANDCVFYDCANKKFEEYVESFGFVTSFGSFSDISVICPSWGVAGVNLSCGYECEHSQSEHLYVGHMLDTIKKVKLMLDGAESAEHFEYLPRQSAFSYGWDPSYGIDKETWDSWHMGMQDCVFCDYSDYDYNMIPFKVDDQIFYICPDCAVKHKEVGWCNNCGEAYLRLDYNKPEICPDCEARINDSNR